MRYEQLSVGVLTVDSIQGSGAPVDLGKGEKYYIDPTNGSNGNSGKTAGTALGTTIIAEGALTTGQNDTLIFMPGTDTITTLLTWNLSNTHLVGSHSATPWSNNCLIQHTATALLSPTILNSGSDNLFANIHFRFAGIDGDNHIGLKNTGSGNHYENCWFEGPCDATQGTDTAHENVQVDGGGNYFKNCIFGTTAHGTMNGAAQLGFTGSAYRSTFEDCIFYMRPAATTGVMIDVSANYDISGAQFFKSCMFVQNWMNHADMCSTLIRTNNAGSLRQGTLVFDANCFAVGFESMCSSGVDAVGVCFAHPMTGGHDGTYAGIIDNVAGSLWGV